MLGFNQYRDNAAKKFVCLVLEDKSQELLRHWCHDRGLDLSKDYDGNDQDPSRFEFHCTVSYSENPSFIETGTKEIERVPMFGDKIGFLGASDTGKPAVPVIHLMKTPELLNIRTIFEGIGLKDKWPEWKPHISLSYNYKPGVDLDDVDPPDFPFYADKIKIEDIKDENG